MMGIRNGLKLVLLLLPGSLLLGQQKYWVATGDTAKVTLPAPVYCSEWLPWCSYALSETEVADLKASCVQLQPMRSLVPLATGLDEPVLGFALEQINAGEFTALGLNGSGIKIGVIDGGFLKANRADELAHFFRDSLVAEYRDYVTPNLSPYEGAPGLDDNHGTEVWQLIGGHHPQKNIQYGLATGATYYLARTDHGGYEKRIEEEYLIQALERMHEQGVRLVNISLGYNKDYTDPTENYTTTQMNGKTTIVAQAVEKAAMEKGMLIVVAAGNEANDSRWRTLSTPGDAPHALTVGASKFEVWDKMSYSSTGPDFVDFVKPDIMVYATEGTSFATPVVTGMAACLWQYRPELSNLEIISLFQQAGNYYPYPNNYVGYGVPTCDRLLQLLNSETPSRPQEVRTTTNKVSVHYPEDTHYVVAFHKGNGFRVINREICKVAKGEIRVKKPEGATQTSVLIGKQVVEIFWD